MTIEEALKKASGMLRSAASRPRLEAEILMSHFLGWERSRLHAYAGDTLEEYEAYFALIKRRERSEPIEYITGKVSFYDIELEVGPGVLIARPETEILVEKAAEIISRYGIQSVAEIGVGSGAVSVVLARKFPHLHIVATDISEAALAYAEKNVKRYGLTDRVELVKSSLLDGVKREVDMVVSNPPYISEDFELPSPLHYEPFQALVGGRQGDELLKEIVDTASERNIAHLVCEMGYDQRESIRAYLREKGLAEPLFYKDLAGLDRGFYLNLKGNQ